MPWGRFRHFFGRLDVVLNDPKRHKTVTTTLMQPKLIQNGRNAAENGWKQLETVKKTALMVPETVQNGLKKA